MTNDQKNRYLDILQGHINFEKWRRRKDGI
ncbi:hypothetical protein LCGC14_0535720 [marine sediment metagenome]|uniref:Uncharacterized protein n=1 Tax=marine sediment metagenome TaxID=412755 RepID=A0A0F9V2J4_9ZZZZ